MKNKLLLCALFGTFLFVSTALADSNTDLELYHGGNNFSDQKSTHGSKKANANGKLEQLQNKILSEIFWFSGDVMQAYRKSKSVRDDIAPSPEGLPLLPGNPNFFVDYISDDLIHNQGTESEKISRLYALISETVAYLKDYKVDVNPEDPHSKDAAVRWKHANDIRGAINQKFRDQYNKHLSHIINDEQLAAEYLDRLIASRALMKKYGHHIYGGYITFKKLNEAEQLNF